MLDLNVIERGIRSIFSREFITRERKAKYGRIATVIDSDKQTERYNAISTLPQMTATEDERIISALEDYTYDLTNEPYMSGIRVPRRLFEFDQTGQLRTLTQSLGSRVSNFPDKLSFQVLGTGDANVGYDGSNFFATDHDLGDGNAQINTFDGGVNDDDLPWSTASARDDVIAAFQADLVSAKERMQLLTDDRGEPWHDDISPECLVIVCHPAMEFVARTAIEASIISNTGNLTVKSVGSILTTNYTEAFKVNGTVRKSTWYLLKIDSPIMPLVFQRFAPRMTFPDTIPEADQAVLQALHAVEVQTVMRTGQNIDATTFFNDEFLFGARAIYAAGYGMWQNAIRVAGAAS